MQSNLVYEKRMAVRENTLEIARKMKKAGKLLTEIADFTDLPMETIAGLQ